MAQRLAIDAPAVELLRQACAAGLHLAGDGHGGLTVTGKKRYTALAEQILDTKEAVLEAWEAYEERCALMEFDGGLPRVDAERLAWACVREQRLTRTEDGGAHAAH
jgi:hypothetical protein